MQLEKRIQRVCLGVGRNDAGSEWPPSVRFLDRRLISVEPSQYYLHFFTPEQPDLNFENPVVRQTLYKEVIRFWLDKGIDGWRIDTANMYSKRLEFPDAPIVE